MASTSRRSSSTDGPTEEECVYETWMTLQRKELTELEEAVAQGKNGLKNEHQLTQLVEKMVQNFQDYANNRSCLARIDVSPLFAPTSCTPLENSVLWIAGCRPSSFIRFVYALCGLDIESHLTEFLQGKKVGDLSELTSKQMGMIDLLQAKTIKEENKLSSRLASLQEDIMDQQLVSKIKLNEVGDQCGNANEALNEHNRYMAGVMEEADNLRMKTLKEIVLNILKPIQAVEYLAAAKKLRLCFQKWGEKRDHLHANK